VETRDAARFVAAEAGELIEAAQQAFGRAHLGQPREVERRKLARREELTEGAIGEACEAARGDRLRAGHQEPLGEERRADIDRLQISLFRQPGQELGFELRVAAEARDVRRVLERLGV
jgi:hypothetical protein